VAINWKSNTLRYRVVEIDAPRRNFDLASDFMCFGLEEEAAVSLKVPATFSAIPLTTKCYPEPHS
jgi:hypothetical protein